MSLARRSLGGADAAVVDAGAAVVGAAAAVAAGAAAVAVAAVVAVAAGHGYVAVSANIQSLPIESPSRRGRPEPSMLLVCPTERDDNQH